MVRTSVVVPVYDDPVGIRRTLDSLTAQTADDYEVVVVDNGSTDQTPTVAAEFANEGPVRLVTERAIQGSYAARNAGIEAATGDVLCFLDADTWVRPGYVERVIEAIEAGGYDYVGCRVVVPTPDGAVGPVGRFDAATAFPVERFLAEDDFAPTCCLSVRRRVIEAVGPFDGLLVSGGDVEFGKRVAAAGFTQAYLREPVVYHPPRAAFGDLWGKYVRVGRGREQLARRHPDRFDPRQLWDPRNVLPGRTRPPSGESAGPATPVDRAVWASLTWTTKLAVAAGRLFERARLGVAVPRVADHRGGRDDG